MGSTTWNNSKRLKKDFEIWSTPNTNTFKSPDVHFKLNDKSEDIYNLLRNQLKKEYTTIITGYSLFSCVCLDLAVNLDRKGYKVKQVVTFGQPKLDNHEVSVPEGINYIRVIDPRDPVSELFPECTSPGQEVILLTGKYHTSPEGNDSSELEKVQATLDQNLQFHSIQTYMKRIAPKIRESILISYSERNKY